MRRIFYALLTAAVAMMATGLFAQQSDIKVLYIASSDPAVGGDAYIVDSLTAMGYTVESIEAGAFSEFYADDYVFDVLVIGESLSSSAVVPYATAGYISPVVSLEGWCVRGNRWALVATDDDFAQVNADNVDVQPDASKHYGIEVIADHPVTAYAGLDVGDVVKWSDEATLDPTVAYWTLPQAAATAVADIEGETDRHTLYAIEPDADDATNPFQERAVIWGIIENGLSEGVATDVFYDIVDGAILWVLGQNTASGIVVPESISSMNIQPNPMTSTAAVSFNLQQAGQVTLEVVDMTGRTVATQSSMMTVGQQRIEFARPATMSAGVYQFNLRLDGRPVGTGKVLVD